MRLGTGAALGAVTEAEVGEAVAAPVVGAGLLEPQQAATSRPMTIVTSANGRGLPSDTCGSSSSRATRRCGYGRNLLLRRATSSAAVKPLVGRPAYFRQPFIEIEPGEPGVRVQGGTEPPGPAAATRRPAFAGRTKAIVVGSAGAARQ